MPGQAGPRNYDRMPLPASLADDSLDMFWSYNKYLKISVCVPDRGRDEIDLSHLVESNIATFDK